MSTSNIDWNTEKEFALSLVKTYAPNEAPLAELIWDEVRDSPSDSLSHVFDKDNYLGIGAGLVESALFSSIVIPVLVAGLSHLITSSVDTLFEYLKSRLKNSDQQLDDETLEKLAEQIAARIQTKQDQ